MSKACSKLNTSNQDLPLFRSRSSRTDDLLTTIHNNIQKTLNPAETDKVNSYQHFVSHPHTYTSWKCLCNTWTLPLTFYLRKCCVFIYKPNINYCPQSAYVILVVIVVVVIMVVFVFVSVFNNKTNVSKYAYVILEQLLMLY